MKQIDDITSKLAATNESLALRLRESAASIRIPVTTQPNGDDLAAILQRLAELQSKIDRSDHRNTILWLISAILALQDDAPPLVKLAVILVALYGQMNQERQN